jgi:predicted neutral ceramidase superfamily lipid hydrolase
MHVIMGALAVLCLYVRNDDRNYLIPLCLSVFGLFAITELPENGMRTEFFMIIWSILTIGFIVSYGLRFRLKQKNAINIVKLIAISLVIAYPLTALLEFDSRANGLPSLIVMVLATVFIYDRYIIKVPALKRKYLILFTVQSILLLLMCVYAYVQKIEADEQRDLGLRMRNETVQQLSELRQEKEENDITRKKMQATIDSLKSIVSSRLTGKN